MKKTLTIATLLSLMAVPLPSFAQSFDPDIGSGNIVPPVANQGVVPPVANQGGANAYAQAPVGPHAYDYGGRPYNYGGGRYYDRGPRYHRPPYRNWTEF
jgi:hypothetical protein